MTSLQDFVVLSYVIAGIDMPLNEPQVPVLCFQHIQGDSNGQMRVSATCKNVHPRYKAYPLKGIPGLWRFASR